MATRTRFNGSSVKVPWKNTIDTPEGFGDQYSRLLGALFDAASFPLTNIGGTEDDVTADLEYVLDGGTLVDGMMFSLTWADTNTGPMTLAINGGAPVSVLDSSGGAMISGGVWSDLRSVIEYIGGSFRIVSDRSSGQSPDPYFTQITASTTWTKPDGYADDAVVFIEAWGGGGGGNTGLSGAGGGGGAYVSRRLRYADLPSSVSVVIGAGGAPGAPGTNGGTTTFGAILTAFAGAASPGAVSTTLGGGGAGSEEGGSSVNGGRVGGGLGGSNNNTTLRNGGDATSEGGGGGGGGGGYVGNLNGGWAVRGGGGGAGWQNTGGVAGIPGSSLHGGDGGAVNSAGQAPGGGGGRAGPGARGEVRITIF